ncbi:MAG TPA: ferric reductase-like transmembrane domain-containing protein [Kofleriaceae bacterium]|nr:ferric reductase-like transmembrane domain-containing protein [Kofleriaceae bacterium]
MRDALRGVLVGLVAIALLGAIASRAGWIETDLPRPTGQGAWMLSRATGLTAFIALALDVIAGLLVSTRIADRWIPRKETVDLHGWLSPLALALVACHALTLVADNYIRFDLVDVLVPFASSYRPVAVGIGVLAAYGAVVVHVSFGLRKRIGPKVWRKLHYLSFVVFTASAVHAIIAGTDAARPAIVALYATPLAIVVGLVAARVTRFGTAQRPR